MFAILEKITTFALANEPKGVWANSRVAKWGRL